MFSGWQRIWPTSLRGRLVLVLMVAGCLPSAGLALVVVWRNGVGAAELQAAAGWLIACLLVSGGLAAVVAAQIARSLRAVEKGLRSVDPELQRELPPTPADAPREIAVIFDQLHFLAARLQTSHFELEANVARGERLRGELMQAIESREQVIAGHAEKLREANSALDRQLRLDPLTGIANRRGFGEAIDRAWRTAMRDSQAVSLLMIDIDHFKAYNECYGRPQGDSCLRAVANTLCHVAGRSLDTVARYGGEEFVIILGNTPLDGALKVAEQVRMAVENMQLPHRAAPGGRVVTVSVGVTSTAPARGTKYDTTLAAADRALAAAKQQGRNRLGYSSTTGTELFNVLTAPGNQAERPS